MEAAPFDRKVGVAVCNPADVRTVAPTAAADNTKRRSTGRAGGIVIRACAVVSKIVPVIAPLVDIACHIIKSVAIGRETADHRGIWRHVIPVRMIATGRAYIVCVTAGVATGSILVYAYILIYYTKNRGFEN